MGAEGAKMCYARPYLSGQWTEKAYVVVFWYTIIRR